MPKQIDPTGLVINTLFGPALATKQCNTCDKDKVIIEFHLASVSRRRHNEQRRAQCKDCWYRFNGDSTFGRKIISYEKMDCY